MAKRHTRRRRQRRNRRKTMKGGAFTSEETQQLQSHGFTILQIERLNDLGVSFDEVMQKVNVIMNQNSDGFHGNSDNISEQVMIEILNENIFDNPANMIDSIPQAEDDLHYLDELDDIMSMDTSLESQSLESQGTMNIDELNENGLSESGYTTPEDISFGGKIRKKSSRKRNPSKKRKTRKNIRRKIKHKGGRCFGNGVGANINNPNFSIHNTNMLKLFPYKPN